MKLKALMTENFRNLSENPPLFRDGLNILYGSNAAGKTNTLEAIYLFAAGKSFRTKSDKDFIAHGKEFAHAQISFETQNSSDRTLAVNFLASGQNTLKAMFVEGNAVDRASEFLGNFRAVLFTPDHLELVKGAPEERRKLVDVALCQIKPRFVKALNEYSKVLAQRNNYLKSAKIKGMKADIDYLDVLNRLLADAGAVIVKQRGLYCEYLDRFASECYGKITGGSERLSVSYITRAKISDLSDEKACADALYGVYKQSVHKDIETGRTSNGPHRDELMIYISKNGTSESFVEDVKSKLEIESDDGDEVNLSGFAARTFGSQGQQRSAVLAMKMAEGEIVKQRCGEYPVYLLDDLFSELDADRKSRLCHMLDGRQCIITACDEGAIPSFENVNVINVKNGKYYTC